MIILRNHGIGISAGSIVITTSETYSQYQHVADQLTDRLVEVKVNHTITFGLTQHFIENEMCGQFPGTMVLFMGCGGLSRQWLADSFLEKGARAFVGWGGTVGLYYDDLAFGLLGTLLIQGHPVDWALQNVTETLGLSGAGLGLAPSNAAFAL